MRLARVAYSGGEDFAVGTPNGTWVPFANFGLSATGTGAAISALSNIPASGVKDGSGVADPEFLCPISACSQVIGIGLNYGEHAAETRAAPPAEPRFFAKLSASLNAPIGVVPLDASLTESLDYEVELAVVIGNHTKGASPGGAMNSVFGYAVANDFTARDCQTRDGQPTRAKGFDGYGPIGPWITTANEINDPQRLRLRTTVNGETRQDSSTADMLFSIADLIAFISAGTTLEPGDVILTGTPPGVGHGMRPARYLNAGDVVVCDVERLGQLRHTVVAV